MFINSTTLKREWFFNTKADILAGAVVGLALIPEAIAFSIIAGVDPKVGLYASFIIAVITAFIGGRIGSISAATGAMALLMVNLVKDHGIEYLFAATLLTGILQVLFGVFKLGKQMKYVPRSVMMGYINALGVLIFLAQLPQLTNVPSTVYLITIASLIIIYILPRFTQAVPSPLVALAVMTIATITLKLDVPTVGDMGELPTALPIFALPNVPLNLETLNIILPYSLTMALVGLLASFLTAALVDKILSEDGNHLTYNVSGQIFFVSVEEFLGKFDFDELVDTVTINLTHAHLWDQGAVAAVDKVVLKFRRNGANVKLIGLNEASSTLLEKLTTQDNPPIVEEAITRH